MGGEPALDPLSAQSSSPRSGARTVCADNQQGSTADPGQSGAPTSTDACDYRSGLHAQHVVVHQLHVTLIDLGKGRDGGQSRYIATVMSNGIEGIAVAGEQPERERL